MGILTDQIPTEYGYYWFRGKFLKYNNKLVSDIVPGMKVIPAETGHWQLVKFHHSNVIHLDIATFFNYENFMAIDVMRDFDVFGEWYGPMPDPNRFVNTVYGTF